MKYSFECADGNKYVVDAESFSDAKDRFLALGWDGDAPRILSYQAFFDGFSILKISIVA